MEEVNCTRSFSRCTLRITRRSSWQQIPSSLRTCSRKVQHNKEPLFVAIEAGLLCFGYILNLYIQKDVMKLHDLTRTDYSCHCKSKLVFVIMGMNTISCFLESYYLQFINGIVQLHQFKSNCRLIWIAPIYREQWPSKDILFGQTLHLEHCPISTIDWTIAQKCRLIVRILLVITICYWLTTDCTMCLNTGQSCKE